MGALTQDSDSPGTVSSCCFPTCPSAAAASMGFASLSGLQSPCKELEAWISQCCHYLYTIRMHGRSTCCCSKQGHSLQCSSWLQHPQGKAAQDGVHAMETGGPTHTQRTEAKGKRKERQEESTYNRKQRNFTCSVVLRHPRIDRKERQTDGEKKSV